MNRKGQVFESLKSLSVGVLGITIVLVIAFLIMNNTKTQINTINGLPDNVTNGMTSVAWNSTNTMVGAVAGIPAWVPLIILGVVGGVLLTLVKLFR